MSNDRKGAWLGALLACVLVGGCTFQTPDLQAFGKQKSLIVPPPMDDGAQTPGERGTCGASDFAGLVGQKWEAGLVELPKGARVIGHGDLVTQDYIPARLNIYLDEKNRVSRVACG